MLAEVLAHSSFRTGDEELDHLLEKSHRKFIDPDINIRWESLEALWDAWERLKTLGGSDKKSGARRC